MLGYYVINYYHGRSLLWSNFSEIDQFLNELLPRILYLSSTGFFIKTIFTNLCIV
jgi:hypothetical protein